MIGYRVVIEYYDFLQTRVNTTVGIDFKIIIKKRKKKENKKNKDKDKNKNKDR